MQPDSPVASSASSKLETAFIQTVLNQTIANQLPHNNGSSHRQPLSIQATTQNFKRFVAKSGPLWNVSNALEDVFTWRDQSKTAFFALLYGILCYRPSLLLLLPTVSLVVCLLYTYINTKHSTTDAFDPLLMAEQAPTKPNVEASADYMENLQNIQIVMGRLSDLTDLGRNIFTYLDWSTHPRISLLLLQSGTLSTFLLMPILTFVPWRLLIFLSVLLPLLASHPLLAPYLKRTITSLSSKAATRRAQLDHLVRTDALPDSCLDGTVQTISMTEEETRSGTQWTEHRFLSEAGFVLADLNVAPPKGSEWVEAWWVCSIGDEGWVTQEGGKKRIRRWCRRAVKP